MSKEKQSPSEKIDDADLEQALDELDADAPTDAGSDVIKAMAAMIEGVRKAVA